MLGCFSSSQPGVGCPVRGGTPVNDGDDMARSAQIGIMGQLSSYTGKQGAWDEFEKSGFFYPPLPEITNMDMEPPVKPGPGGLCGLYAGRDETAVSRLAYRIIASRG